MSAKIRLATPSDAAQILEIYAPQVRATAVSFELEPPTTEAMAARIAGVTSLLPWLVLEDAGTVLGYAYATQFNERAAYAWSVDVAVYVRETARRRGVASALYVALFETLRLSGVRNAVAIIALPNPASVALHEALGFRLVGRYPHIGYKLGAWRDVGHWLLSLAEDLESPVPPDFCALAGTAGLEGALAAGLRRYNPGT